MALMLGEYAPPGTDLGRVLRLLLVHDLIEIGAGDLHFDHTPEAHLAQMEREKRAADALFDLLPADQQSEFQALWQEFEAQATTEARFARALDALQPMLLTWGRFGKQHGVGCTERYPELTRQRLMKLKEPRLKEFPALWDAAQKVLSEAVETGILGEG